MRIFEDRIKRRIWKMGIEFLTIAAILAGCGKNKGAGNGPEPVSASASSENLLETQEIKEISFGAHGMSIPEISGLTLTRSDEGTCVRLEIWNEYEYEQTEDAALMDQACELLKTYRVDTWNGFHGSNSMVLDGGGFSIRVVLQDGTVISASGTNSYPPDYGSVASGLMELVEPVRKKWRDSFYPKVVEDTEIVGFLFRVFPQFGGAKFECSFEDRVDDPGKQYMRAKISNGYGPAHPDCVNYSFYGTIPAAPFEALQEIAEKYDLAAWNGYEEFETSDKRERSFYLNVSYSSGESISASGTIHPEHYEEAESEIIQVIWDYIEEHKDEFVPWE